MDDAMRWRFAGFDESEMDGGFPPKWTEIFHVEDQTTTRPPHREQKQHTAPHSHSSHTAHTAHSPSPIPQHTANAKRQTIYDKRSQSKSKHKAIKQTRSSYYFLPKATYWYVHRF
jgi:hypothetical protein